MKFNQRMKDTRIDEEKTQAEIADILGITQQQYQLYESGKRKMPIDQLIDFCKYLKVSADYILGLPRGLNWPREY